MGSWGHGVLGSWGLGSWVPLVLFRVMRMFCAAVQAQFFSPKFFACVPTMPSDSGSSSRSRRKQPATGSKTKTMTKKNSQKKKKTEKKHAADSDVDVQSAKRKAQPRPPDHPPPADVDVNVQSAKRKLQPRQPDHPPPPDHLPATGGIVKRRKRSLPQSSDCDSRTSDSKRYRHGRERRRPPSRARVRSPESAPGGKGDRASPPMPDWSGTDEEAKKVVKQSASPLASGSDEDVKKEVSRSASPPPSGSDEDDKKERYEGDKRDASPRAKLVPASGGSSSRHSFWSRVPSKSKGSKAAEKGKGKGKGKPGKLASGGSIHPTARYSLQHSYQHFHIVHGDLHQATASWYAWPSNLLLEPDGLADFARRNTRLVEENWLPQDLIEQLPEDPSAAAWREEGWEMPATGGSTREAWSFIRELCLRHRGEVRELRGYWEEFDGPLSIEMLNPQFNGSFIRVSGELAMQRQLAAGSWGRRGELEIRVARVFGLADLFAAFGASYTAKELYEYYESRRVIAARRPRGQRAWCTW